MADESYVRVNEPGANGATPGKRLATFEYMNGDGDVVEAEAVTLVDGDGDQMRGQRIAAESMPVVLASDQPALVTTSTDAATMASGTLGALNDFVEIPVSGPTVGVRFSSGLSATVVCGVSYNGGVNYVDAGAGGPCMFWRAGIVSQSLVFIGATTSQVIIGIDGATHVRVRVSLYTSGSCTVELASSPAGPAALPGFFATGVALPAAPTAALCGVSDGTNARAVKGDSSGRPAVNVEQWLGSAAPTVGQKTMANSVPMVIASDQSAVAVSITEANGAATGTIDAGSSLVTLALAGKRGISVKLTSSSFLGTLQPLASYDNGASYQAVAYFVTINGGLRSTSLVDPASQSLQVIVGSGATHVAVFRSAYTSGSISVRINATENESDGYFTRNATGSPVPPECVYVGGALGANLTPLPLASVGGGNVLVSGIGGWFGSNAPTVGQKTMANSVPVVIPSDQSAIPVSSTQLPAALVGGRLDENIGAWLGSTAPTVGQKTAANSLPVILASDQPAIATSIPDASSTGTIDGGTSLVALAVAGRRGFSVKLTSSSFLGTIRLVASFDNGASYAGSSGFFVSVGGGIRSASLVDPSSGTYQIIVGSGATHIAIDRLAYTSGSLDVRLSATAHESDGYFTRNATGQPTPPECVYVGGALGGNLAAIPLSSVGGGNVVVSGISGWFGSNAPTIGQKTMADSLPIVVASDQSNIPANVAAWLGSTAPTIGQKTMANAVPVSIASDQSALTVKSTAGTLANGAETAVSNSAVQIIAANSNRRKLIVQNTGNANIRVGVTGVTATTGLRLVPGGSETFDEPACPTNAIYAIREGAVDSIVFAQEVT